MKVHHMGYLVKNMTGAINYFKILGYNIGSINRNETRGVDICFIENFGSILELISPYRDDSDVSGLLKKHANMIYHVCYESGNLDKDISHLKQNGFITISNVSEAPSIGEDAKVIFLANREIGIIELVQMKGVHNNERKTT